MDVLLLEVVLPRAARLAAGEGALVVPLAGVHARMAREVARRRERALARRADVFLFRRAASSCTCTTSRTSCVARGGRTVRLWLVGSLRRLGRHGLGRGGCAGERLRVRGGRGERGGVCGVCACACSILSIPVLSVLSILLLLLLDVAVVHLLLLLLGGREVVHGRGRHRLVGGRVGHRVGPRVLGVVCFVDGLARHRGERVGGGGGGGRAGGVGCVLGAVVVRRCVVGVVESGLASGGLP